jgi:apolipoprotein N-acyltransferase
VVRLVQPNAAQHLKWDPDLALEFFLRQVGFTAAAPPTGAPRPALVVWPEVAVPYALDRADAALERIAAAAQGAEVALGIQRQDDAGRWFNAMVRLDETGRLADVYDKHHLVPFGEYMPFADLFARWGIFGLAANLAGGFTPGPGPRLVDFGPVGRVLPLICYEVIFPRGIARAGARPDLLLQLTNDAWFGEVSGPWQHLAQARLRAVEQGLPLMRAANTGISAGFDPWGRELGRIALGTAGFVDLPLPRPLPPTPYARWGDWPVLPALAVLAALGFAVFRRPAIDAPAESA